jgi:hypothetical protein
LRRRQPDSISNLIVASSISNKDLEQKNLLLEKKLIRLTEEMDALRFDHQASIRLLRDQHDSIVKDQLKTIERLKTERAERNDLQTSHEHNENL